RDTEIERVAQILGRRTKNNPVLIGEPGVGKTAIVEGLAQKIASGDVSDTLAGKRLLTVDLASVVAGTKYRGEFEQRLKSILEEIRSEQKRIIIFIDELHTIIGAGAAEGAIDASNMLKPALARGELQCIGATTFDEYRKHIEHDPALERRFQPIIVDPPTIDQTIDILNGIREKYEQHHKVRYSDEAIIASAVVSDRYITDRAMPDKAIDLLDEAGSRARLQVTTVPPLFKDKEAEIEKAVKEKNDSIAEQEYEKAARARDREKVLRGELDENRQKWRAERAQIIPEITPEDIARVASKWTGIPVTRITEKESEKLMHIEEELHHRVIGQEEALKTISQAIRRSRTGLKDPNKPIGGFLFLGPTGVGKTELARALAEYLFGNEDAMVRIDMSEFMEKHAVSRLIGAPPGYVGYDEGGQLTEVIRRRPYSVVVLDEIEKAHPDIFNILLQVLDEGRLTDNLGHKVSFKNAIVIMTSNVGARLIMKGKSLGFVAQQDEARDYKKMKDTVMEEVRRVFNPEFINRIDEIVVFHPLNEEHMEEILELMLKKVELKLGSHELELELTAKAKKHMVKIGFDPNYGARPLLRAIQKHLEDPLSEELLSGRIQPNSTVVVDLDKDGEKLVFTSENKEKCGEEGPVKNGGRRRKKKE
ncbi:MAG: AAA family ATPase, partial [Elusimicrobiaceae bacterium]